MPQEAPAPSVLATREGKLTLALLCGVAFLDFVDASIVNVALPSIRDDIGFSVQSLQWVLSAYLLTYGGFMLLGGRMADLLGRRRILVTGTVLFAVASLTAGIASTEAMLIGARLIQGAGAAMMIPSALSILTTTFSSGTERNKALGAWGAMAGLGSAAGVFLGGVLSAGPGWRWVFFVNLPVCVVALRAMFRLIPAERGRAVLRDFDALGAVLATGGMLLLVYAIVEAPDIGWGATRTILELAGAAAILGAFAVNELRRKNPLLPFSIFRIPGLAAADATQVIAIAGFYSMFFFTTLYMQNVLGFSRVAAGAAYLPATFGVAIAAGIASQLFGRIGTRPVIVVGALLGAGGIFWLSRIPVDGSYATDLLPALVIMSFGLGATFVGVTTAAQAGVPPDRAGLAAALINASTFLGGALGIAIFSSIATSRTTHLLAAGASQPEALTAGFQRALLACAVFVFAAALIALRATNSRGEPVAEPVPEAVPQPEAA
ncbi:MAG TPA: MFS transporter [Solirubrobacterales bacterium]|jgi:EmrB/QacA subfamily drug resistance transporter